MKIAQVTGTVVSTIKYDKYVGMKLLRVRHLTLEGQPTGEELVALDAAVWAILCWSTTTEARRR